MYQPADDVFRTCNFIVLSTDTTLTRFFDYRAAEGNLEQALRQPNKVALSAACARKLFGSREAVGQHIEVQMEGGDRQTYEVAAVLKEREQSLLRFDMLTASAANYWGGPTLLKLSKGTNAARLADKINADKVPTMLPGQTKYYLDPLEAVCFTTPDDASQQVLDYISQTPVQTLYISLLALQLHQHEPLAPAATAPHDPRGKTNGRNVAAHPYATFRGRISDGNSGIWCIIAADK